MPPRVSKQPASPASTAPDKTIAALYRNSSAESAPARSMRRRAEKPTEQATSSMPSSKKPITPFMPFSSVKAAVPAPQKKSAHHHDEHHTYWLTRLIDWGFYKLAFLMPLFFLPWTSDFLEISKQAVLVLIAGSVLVLASIDMVVRKRFFLKGSLLSIAVIIGWVGALVAAIFSRYPLMSFIGIEQQQSFSFLTCSAFAILFLVGINYVRKTTIPYLLTSFFSSTALVAVTGLMSLFGASPFFWIPNAETMSNTIGFTSLWAGFLGCSLVFAVATLIHYANSPLAAKRITVGLTLSSVASVAALILVDDWRVWAATFAGLFTVLLLSLVKLPQEKKLSWIALPTFLIVVCLGMFWLNLPKTVTIPMEVTPSIRNSAAITWNTLRSAPWTGFGQGTFAQSYSLFKPASTNNINQYQYWAATFEQSGSALLTKIANTGIAGIISLFGALVAVAWYSFRLFRTLPSEDPQFGIAMAAFGSLIAFSVLHVVHSASMATVFGMWLSLFVLGIIGARTLRYVPFDTSTLRFAFTTVGASALTVLSVFGMVGYGILFSADLWHAKALHADARLTEDMTRGKQPSRDDVNTLIESLDHAEDLSPLHHAYPRMKALVLAYKAANLAPGAESAQALEELKTVASDATETAQHAIDLNPKDVRNVMAGVRVYQTIAPFTQGTSDYIKQYLESALILDPSNPAVQYELGSLALSDALRQKETSADASDLLKKADEHLERAIGLKPDYAEAYLQMGVVRTHQNNKAEALRLFNVAMKYNVELTLVKSADAELFYSLGVAYRSIQEYPLALNAFQRAISLIPGHANSLYQIALINEDQGDMKAALQIIQYLLGADPKNVLLLQKEAELTVKMKAPAAPVAPAPGSSPSTTPADKK